MDTDCNPRNKDQIETDTTLSINDVYTGRITAYYF